jgi:threonine dehydrogenase-like Zn-dependent dehydrogenase
MTVITDPTERDGAGGVPSPAGAAPEPAIPAGGGPRGVDHIGFRAPHEVEIFHYEEGELPPGQFRVKTLYCGISTGTEMTHFQGTSPYLESRWDDELKLFRDGEGAGWQYPLPFSGYMQSGRVEASRAEGVRAGDAVGMTYGHKTGHTVDPRHELFWTLPPDLDPVLGIYVAQMGPICANGVLHADADAFGPNVQAFGAGVRGRSVLVCGTGVIGLLVGMMCQWAGASEVGIAGRNPFKLGVAQALGMIPFDTRREDVGVAAKTRWHDGAGGRGAHVAFQCSGSDALLNDALRALEPQGAVVDLGFYQGGADRVLLGREFHHNGLRHVCAQIGRVPRPLAGAWDRRRLASETVAFLQAEGGRVREHLITHRFPFAEAQRAFDLLSDGGKDALQVVLEC